MAAKEDASDLFAVPDFWRPSAWCDKGIHDIGKQNPFFALQVDDAQRPRHSEHSQQSQHAPDAIDRARDAAWAGTSHGLINIGSIHVLEAAENCSDVFFKLPSLLREQAERAPELSSQPSNALTSPSHHEGPEQPEPEPLLSSDDDDLWLSSWKSNDRTTKVMTWEGFEQPHREPRPPLFLSEAGPAAFDALLASRQPPGDAPPDLLDPASYCACLLNLALGRSSVLFSWDADKSSFVKTAPHLRISGLTLDLIKAVDMLCIGCGNSARHLQSFAEAAYAAATTPTRVALAGVVDRLVLVLRSELSNRGRDARSPLQLQSAVQPVRSVLSYFNGLVKRLAQEDSDEGILSLLFQEAQALEYRDELLKAVTREVLRILSQPWTDFIEEWIGLKPEEHVPITKASAGKGFVKVADKMWIDDQGFELEEADYFLDEHSVPIFVPEDMAQAIFETGRNLRFLREHHPEHPLSGSHIVAASGPPKLQWEFDWDGISKLEARVNQYRDAVSRAVQGILPAPHRVAPLTASASEEKRNTTGLECFGRDEAQVEASLVASMRRLDQPLEIHAPRDRLTRLLHERLYRASDILPGSNSLCPHWDLVPLLSFGPVIEAQSSLVNHECMKLLFTSHRLRVHIDLLRQYFLFGNGLLCSRLSHALFDPNLDTAERRAGVALGGGVMGLRLGGRQTWPPASSELRLALMGVLSECYELASSHFCGGSRKLSDLPGDLSFAVRDLSPEEIDRCMDPDSLEALDFLRLSYKPPAALRAVMTPTVLAKYDRVFKLFLRVLRMLYVANELLVRSTTTKRGSRDDDHGYDHETNASLRLRLEARHFIRQVASYFFSVGIAAPWARFEVWLDKIESEVTTATTVYNSNNNNANLEGPPARLRVPVPGPDAVRERHERALDEVARVLLLRRRQAPVLALLEDIFGAVLRFAKALRARRAHRDTADREREDGELYAQFRKKVDVFVTVCRGLAEKSGSSSNSNTYGKGDAEDDNPVERLLVMLDMGGFYGKGHRVYG